jgi:hypothetical protein
MSEQGHLLPESGSQVLFAEAAIKTTLAPTV